MKLRLRKKLGRGEFAYPYNHHPKLSERTREALATLIQVAKAALDAGIELPDESYDPLTF